MTEKSNKLHLELQKLQSKIMGLEEKLNDQPLKSITDRHNNSNRKVFENMSNLNARDRKALDSEKAVKPE